MVFKVLKIGKTKPEIKSQQLIDQINIILIIKDDHNNQKWTTSCKDYLVKQIAFKLQKPQQINTKIIEVLK